MTSLDATAVQDGVPAQRSAGTPPPFREAGFPAKEALEFAEVLEVVAGFAAGPLGAARVRSRRPARDAEWIRAELAPVAELLTLLERGTSVDVGPVPPVDSILGRLRLAGSVLQGTELVALRETLSVARAAASAVCRVLDQAPSLGACLAPLPEPSLDRRLAQALDEAGEVLDRASPALLRARRGVQESRTKLVKKLEGVLRGLGADGDVTLRNGRYVIPVRRDSRQRLEGGGIVHDESASAETLFIEPTAVIELGNAHRAAIADAEREALKVLRDLTDLLRPQADLLEEAHRHCVALDDLLARVRYAHSVGGQVPALLAPGAGVELRNVRHPLLLARGIPAIPFDLMLDPGERTLLISGPNAGGKTVLLKALGLMAALVQSGIVPPLAPGSALPVFERIGADIGDHQSIAADLSTFTARVVVLRELLGGAGPGSLVLIDEIGSGTDPAEGGALAAAALGALTRAGSLTVATTHLGALKTLAAQTPGGGIVNGSLQFDPERLAPTFKFAKGPPGRSYGLAIARRLGIGPEVLADAESRISEAERSLDALLEAAERRERTLAAGQAELEARLAEVERETARQSREGELLKARETDLAAREKTAERRARGEAKRVMLEARAEVEAALRAAQLAGSDAAETEARRTLEQAIRREGEAIESLAPADRRTGERAVAVQPGQRVRLGSGSIGRVLELRDDGTVLVAAGNVKVVLPVGDVTPVEGGAGEKPRSSDSLAPRLPGSPAPSREIDLRGLRADEAEAATLSALDAAVLDDQPYLRIIHGMGTGALRQVVRQVLAADRRVRRFGFAPANQGGVGVTVAEFAE